MFRSGQLKTIIASEPIFRAKFWLASIPGTVCAALSDKLSDKKQMIFQAFGIGLSWGACQLELNNPTVLRPVVYGEYGCRI